MEGQLADIRKERENLLANLVEAEYVIQLINNYNIQFYFRLGNKSCFGNGKFN